MSVKLIIDKLLSFFFKTLSFFLPAFIIRFIFDFLRSLKKNNIIFKLLYLYSGYFNKKYSSTFKNQDSLFKTFLDYKIILPSSDPHFLKRSLGVYHPLKIHDKIENIFKKYDCKNFGEVGSHLGEMSLFLTKICHSLNVKNHIFELDKNFCNYVKQSLRENNFKNTFVNHCVIGTDTDVSDNYYNQKSFYKNFPKLRSSPIEGMNYFLKDDLEKKVTEISTAKPLNLNDYFKDDYVDFWFMDVEGSEIFIIPQILSLNKKFNKKPIIFFETHFERYNQQDIISLKSNLKNCGYQFSSIDKRHLICF